MTKSKSFEVSAKDRPKEPSSALKTGYLNGTERFLKATGVQRVCRSFQRIGWRNQLILLGLVISFLLGSHLPPSFEGYFQPSPKLYPPLAMAGGNPYVRALMRTISASESNDLKPYGLLYGGQYFSDWSRHPDRCIVIQSGPNQGDCTTAAGRYQFITTTWEEKAQHYHPNPDGWFLWQHYSFDPVSQDRVVHRWLSDSEAWGVDIPALLKAGQLNAVLDRLSGTWTSLGYGIETNDMTPHLNGLYQRFLREELAQSKLSKSPQKATLQ
jgi:muramidase (phage lysozyme)